MKIDHTDFVNRTKISADEQRVEFIEILVKGKAERFAYIARERVTLRDRDGNEIIRNIYPNYIQNLVDGNYSLALLNVLRNFTMLLNEQLNVKFQVSDMPITCSANIRPGTYAFDFNPDGSLASMILNEDWALARAIDADGDRGSLIFNKDMSKAVLDKRPITQNPPILEDSNILHVHEGFYSLGLKDTRRGPGLVTLYDDVHKSVYASFGRMIETKKRALIELPKEEIATIEYNDELRSVQNEEAAFLKCHTPADVGTRTTLWNLKELKEGLRLPQSKRMKHLCSNYGRYEDIELGAMKAQRKDSQGHAAASIEVPFRLKPHVNCFLTGCNRIASMQMQEFEWIFSTNIPKLLARMQHLELTHDDFILRSESVPVPVPQVHYKKLENTLIKRLMATGRLKVVAYQHQGFPFNSKNVLDRNTQPLIALYLTRPNGKIAGLTDVKRGDGKSSGGVTYCFLLPPVFNGTEWVHPLYHMAEQFATVVTDDAAQRSVGRFDSRILRPADENGQRSISAWFGSDKDARGRYLDHFIKYPVKVAALLKQITEYCGVYGFDVAGIKDSDRSVTPDATALGFAKLMTIIDYGKDSTEHDMLEVFKRANAGVRLCVGNKQSSRSVRRYVLAHSNGVAKWAPSNSHIARPGKQASQLLRALKRCEMTVAVLRTDSTYQCHITPSGVKKQSAESAYLCKVFNTRLAFKRHCEKNGLTFDIGEQIDYVSWSGEARRCWILPPRDTIQVGKLVDTIGNKFIPRRVGQFYVPPKGPNDPVENIDVIMPIGEIIAKGAMRAMLGDDVPKHLIKKIVTPDGDVVEAIVLKHVFYRTGSASENIPARNRWANMKGMDKYPILASVREMMEKEDWKFVYTDIDPIFKSVKRIKALAAGAA